MSAPDTLKNAVYNVLGDQYRTGRYEFVKAGLWFFHSPEFHSLLSREDVDGQHVVLFFIAMCSASLDTLGAFSYEVCKKSIPFSDREYDLVYPWMGKEERDKALEVLEEVGLIERSDDYDDNGSFVIKDFDLLEGIGAWETKFHNGRLWLMT